MKDEELRDRLLGGLYGLLIGDAAGVPYEFQSAHKIPDNVPLPNLNAPKDFDRTYPRLKPGTWSDDGAQALILLETLVRPGGYSDAMFLNGLINWKDLGYMAVDNYRFDIGNQTNEYLNARQHGFQMGDARLSNHCGNGSLMRALPVALIYDNLDLIKDISEKQSNITHPQYVGTVSCVLYNAIALNLLHGFEKAESMDRAIEYVLQAYRFGAPEFPAVQTILKAEFNEPTGSGYVVDSLWSACSAFITGNSYAEVIGDAIKFGNDTDTTACIAGGLAGIYYGYNAIPETFITALRQIETVDELSEQLLKHRGL